MPCKFPGCVAQAADGDEVCPVHATGAGKPCGFCKGTGRVIRGTARAPEPCDRCGGVGVMDQRRRAAPVVRGADPVDARGLIVLAGEDER